MSSIRSPMRYSTALPWWTSPAAEATARKVRHTTILTIRTSAHAWGLAWAPSIFKGKTTVRSGFGMYYGGNQNDDFSDPAESAVPRYSLAQSDFPTLGYPLVAFLDPKNQLFAPKAIDRHRKDMYYENWDFVIQQQLPKDFIAQVGYVGDRKSV